MAQHHGALKTHPSPRPGHCDCQTEKEEEDKAPLMSTALSPNTLQPGRLPATAADPRETPSPSISHTCPPERGDGAGTSPVGTGQDTGVPSPAPAGGTFVTSSQEVASDAMPRPGGKCVFGDKVHPQQGTTDTFTPSHTPSLLKGSPGAQTGDASGMEDTAPAAPSSSGRPLCLQAELAPGTAGPSTQSGTLLPVSSQHQVLPYRRVQPRKMLSSPSILAQQ